MTRRNTSPAAEGDTGQRAYREPGDPVDERPVISRRPIFRDSSEELAWLYAAEQARPFRKADTFLEHLERIAKLAGAELAGPAVKPMPEVRLPYADDAA